MLHPAFFGRWRGTGLVGMLSLHPPTTTSPLPLKASSSGPQVRYHHQAIVGAPGAVAVGVLMPPGNAA